MGSQQLKSAIFGKEFSGPASVLKGTEFRKMPKLSWQSFFFLKKQIFECKSMNCNKCNCGDSRSSFPHLAIPICLQSLL